MEVEVIKTIQTIRNPFLDAFFSAITVLGDEMFFIAIGAILFWCFDKRFGYKFINVYLLGNACVEGVKSLVARPRPYTHEGIVSVTERTSGYSFPSGHSHSVGNMSTQLGVHYRKKALYIGGAVLCLLVTFSRLYLGQHFVSDVLVGVALGVGCAFAFGELFELLKDKEEYIVLGVVPLCAIILIVLIACGGLDGADNVLKVLGAYSALSIGYFLEKKYVRLDVKCKWWMQIVKAVVGLLLVLAVKEGVKLILPKDIPLLYSFLRYFLVGITASLGACALFKVCRLEPKRTQTPKQKEE
jgi:undecaprenyl-diphosphatase